LVGGKVSFPTLRFAKDGAPEPLWRFRRNAGVLRCAQNDNQNKQMRKQQQIPHSTSLRAGSSGMTTRKATATTTVKAWMDGLMEKNGLPMTGWGPMASDGTSEVWSGWFGSR
jgi:hypothetical protein